MIHEVIKVLQSQDFYGDNQVIEEAKGKYAIPKTIKEIFTQWKRTIISSIKSNGRLK
jgi:hypothetical protein